MKRRYLTAVVFLLCGCSVLHAQGDGPKPAFPKREFKHANTFSEKAVMEDGVETNYVFLDKTIVKPFGADPTSFSLMASFQFDGKALVRPKHISLNFYRDAFDCQMSLHPTIEFAFDGVSLQMPDSVKGWRDRKPDEEGVASRFGKMYDDGLCHEFTHMYISQKNFLRLVSSKEVEVRIDSVKFKLSVENLEALRDLASRMAL
jgi:hypothetical protein